MASDKEDYIAFAAAGAAILLVGFLGYRQMHPTGAHDRAGGAGPVATDISHDLTIAKREDCTKPGDFCLVLPKVPLAEAERVFVADRHRSWVYGGTGFLARLDDSAITVEARLGSEAILAMAESGEDEVWAAGSEGSLLRFDGKAWAKKDSGVADDIVSIAAPAKGEVWIVTRGSKVLRSNGGAAFEDVSAGLEPRDLISGVRSILAPKRGVVWLVPQTGSPYRWSGKAWSRTPVEKAAETFAVAAAAVDDSGELWLFPWRLDDGYAHSESGKITFATFEKQATLASGIVTNATGRGGRVCVTTADGQVFDVRKSVATARARVPGFPEGASIAGSDCFVDTAVFLEHGAIARLDGKRWHDSRSAEESAKADPNAGGSATGEIFHAVAGGVANEVWVASSTHLYRATGAELTPVKGAPGLSVLLEAGGDVPYGASPDGRVFHRGQNGFALIDLGAHPTATPIAADPSGALLLVTDGAAPELVRWKGGVTEKLGKVEERLTIAFAVAENDLWAAGESLWHGDGKAWKKVAAPPIDGFGRYASFHGTGPTDVWATGDLGKVRHWDGATWQIIATPNYYDVLNKVWADRPGHALFVGVTGAVFEWDGQTMTRVPSGTRRALYDVWSKDGVTWITGEDVVLRRGPRN